MRRSLFLQKVLRRAVKHRLLLSLGLSAACGIVLQSLYPVQQSDPLLRLIAIERPAIYQGLLWSYALFLFSTPFLVISILFSLAYVHFYAPDDRSNGRALARVSRSTLSAEICSWSLGRSISR